jgi:hypothetical protein
MPIENKAWSAASLAKTIASSIDPSKVETTIATATLQLLCQAVMDAAQMPNAGVAQALAARAVAAPLQELATAAQTAATLAEAAR